MTVFCPECFADRSLRSQLTKARPKLEDVGKCDFHPSRKGIPGTYVAEIVDGAIRTNYGWAEYNPYVEEGESLDDLIDGLVGPETDEIRDALKNELEDGDEYDVRRGGEPFYDDTQNFVRYENSYNPLSEMWERFKFDIVHQQRFFSDRGINWLKQIFSELEHQKDRSGHSPIYTVSPGEQDWTVYRARRIDLASDRDDAMAAPAAHLGPPPERLRRAGRMNASGVACLYGAFDVATCLSEIRPPVGSWVISAGFELRRPITVLDMTRFSGDAANRSIFSPVRQQRLDQWRFMQVFQNEITKPVLPDDEVLDYIPTQAVSEFIHVALAAEAKSDSKRIDGIIYGSAQRPSGRNIALFGEAALIKLPDDQGEEAALSRAAQSGLWDDGAGYVRPNLDAFLGPNHALQYQANSAKVHHITGVELQWHTPTIDDDDDGRDF